MLEHAGTVARAACDAGADYFDLLLTGEAKFAALEELRPRLEAEGRCFITDGGIHPGLSALLIRALAPAFGRLERADVGGLLKVDWAAYDFQPSTIHEFANEFRDYRMETLRDGVWQRIEWRDAMRAIDFGPPWGRQRCSLMYMKELELLPEQLPRPAHLRFLRLRVQPGGGHDRAAARDGRDEVRAGHCSASRTRGCSPGRCAASAGRRTAPCSRLTRRARTRPARPCRPA